ncbi:MAG: hypothetical protein IJH55_04915 [Romboutsia sp.]|nr:hypothetical protein [Romboutsia sp.]
MNKIFTLYDIEFKRSYKIYFSLIAALLLGNIGTFVYYVKDAINIVASQRRVKPSLALLKTELGKTNIYFSSIDYTYNLTTIILGFCVISCLIYAVVIWYRDFLGKSKTSYTLFMLPTNKFNIYIAKLMMILTMIYTLIIIQLVAWGIEVSIIHSLTNLPLSKITSRVTLFLSLTPLDITSFIMIDVLGVILAVVVIFTGIMLQKSSKRFGIIKGLVYILAVLVVYLLITIDIQFSDILLIRHSIFYIVTFALSIYLSYKLINNNIHI